MPTSQIDVINQVLNEIARPAIDAVLLQTGAPPDALVVQNKLNLLLPDLLLRGEWVFAVKYLLNNTPNTVSFSPDFLYSYTLPPDYGRFYALSPLSTYNANFGLYYAILDGQFCTNSKPLQLYYIVNNVDYSVLPAAFTRALVYYCAFEVSMPLTNNLELTAYLKQKYKEALTDAVRYNDMERMVISTPFNDFDRQVYI